jgi:hypothetical protein
MNEKDKRTLGELHFDICNDARTIIEKKNNDYRGGSGDTFANFRGSRSLGIDPVVGVLLRMQDKMMRIKTFNEKGMLQICDESVKDAVMDIINYAVIVYGMVKEEKLVPPVRVTEPIEDRWTITCADESHPGFSKSGCDCNLCDALERSEDAKETKESNKRLVPRMPDHTVS